MRTAASAPAQVPRRAAKRPSSAARPSGLGQKVDTWEADAWAAAGPASRSSGPRGPPRGTRPGAGHPGGLVPSAAARSHRRHRGLRPGAADPGVEPGSPARAPVLEHARSLGVDDVFLETC